MIGGPTEARSGDATDAGPTDHPDAAAGGPVLLYDGLCGFCNASVQFILRHERRHTLRFAALQGSFAREVKRRHPSLDDVDSLVWLEESGPRERVAIRSRAALAVAGYLGGFWRVLLIFTIIPAPVGDFFYDVFARHRYRWFGTHASCPLPPTDVRSRFLA